LSSQAHEKNDSRSRAVEAANGSARAALPAERNADADAIKTASNLEPASAPLEYRLRRHDGHYISLTWEPAQASQQARPTAKPETI
jgi:hypothetical protein